MKLIAFRRRLQTSCECGSGAKRGGGVWFSVETGPPHCFRERFDIHPQHRFFAGPQPAPIGTPPE
jgi:hypothetical protein